MATAEMTNLKVVPEWRLNENDRYQCQVLICPEEEGGYSAMAMRLPGVVSQGETVEEAIVNIKEAFCGVLDAYRELNETIPWQEVDMEKPTGSIERWILVDV